MADVKFEIVKHVCVLSDRGRGWTREVNLVKWNDGEPKLDMRDWSPDRSSMRKGLTLTRSEFLVLVKALRSVKAEEITDGRPVDASVRAAENSRQEEYTYPDELRAASGE
ncbi:MAG: hypothetical protein ILO53_01620 [Clostridia bacterium]|nr:hypothetical protein [Clostridia bacterium]